MLFKVAQGGGSDVRVRVLTESKAFGLLSFRVDLEAEHGERTCKFKSLAQVFIRRIVRNVTEPDARRLCVRFPGERVTIGAFEAALPLPDRTTRPFRSIALGASSLRRGLMLEAHCALASTTGATIVLLRSTMHVAARLMLRLMLLTGV